MSEAPVKPQASNPEDLARLFVECANRGDVDGLVALYEPDAVLALPDGRVAAGSSEIRKFYLALLSSRLHFTPGLQRPALRCGVLALTSTKLATGAVTAEIARQQANGSWRWVVDQPAIATENGAKNG